MLPHDETPANRGPGRTAGPSAAQPHGPPCSPPCTLGRRLLVMAYDAVAVVALLMLTTALAMAAGFRELSPVRDPGYAAGLLATWFVYLAWCWHRGGMTLGMRAWRVRIESLDGGRPGWGACGMRFVASLLAAGAAGLGFLWSLVDPQRRCWHDILSKTRLVRQL